MDHIPFRKEDSQPWLCVVLSILVPAAIMFRRFGLKTKQATCSKPDPGRNLLYLQADHHADQFAGDVLDVVEVIDAAPTSNPVASEPTTGPATKVDDDDDCWWMSSPGGSHTRKVRARKQFCKM